MKSLFEEMGGTYRQEGDYLIPNLALPDEPEYQILCGRWLFRSKLQSPGL